MKKQMIMMVLVFAFVAVTSAYSSPASEKLFFRMNDTDNTITDFSGNGNTGDLINSPLTGITGIDRGIGSWGDGLAVEFDASQDQYVNVSNPSSIPSGSESSYVVGSLWANFNDLESENNELMSYVDSGDGWVFRLENNDGGDAISKNDLILRTQGGNTGTLGNSKINKTDVWYHIVFEWDNVNDEVTFWVTEEGSPSVNNVGTISLSDTSVVDTGTPFQIGNGFVGESSNLNAKIDEVKVFDDAVNSTEVSNLYNYNSINDLGGSTNNSAPSVSNVSPTDDASSVSTNSSLSVDVSDSDGDSMNVTFKWGNGTIIQSFTDVSNSNVITDALSLSKGTTYNWQVEVTDGTNTTLGGNYSFTTKIADSTLGSYSSPASEKLFFRMNDTDNTITDFSGSGNTGDTVNNPLLGASGVDRGDGTWDDGTAIQFDGENQEYIEVSNPSSIPEGNEGNVFTVSTWVNADDYATGGNANQIIGYNDGNDGWFLQHECSAGDPCDDLKLRVYGDNTGSLADGVFPSLDTWYHVLVEWDGSNDEVTIWVTENSSSSINKIGSVSVTDTSTVPDGSSLYVGRGTPTDGSGTGYYNGSIDEVKIYDQAVNATEASNIFNYNSLTLQDTSGGNGGTDSPKLSIDSPFNGESFVQNLTSNVTPTCFVNCSSLELGVGNGSNEFYSSTEQNAFSGPNNPSSVFVEEVNSTFITITGADLDPYVTYYNHSTSSWGDVVEAGDNVLTADGHGSPAITVDQSGYIHIVFGSHNSNFQYVKSSNPYHISSWDTQSAPTGTDTTYPNWVTMPNGDIYLFYRKTNSNSDKPITFVKSTDEGSSWSSPREVVDFDTDNWMYVHRVYHDGNGNIWFSFLERNKATPDERKDAFTAYYDISTDTVKSVSGTDFGLTMTNQEAKPSDALIYDSGDAETNYIVTRLSPSGVPHTIFLSDASGTWDYLYSYWNGSDWSNPQTIATAGDQFAHHDFKVNSDGSIDAYLPISQSDSRGGNITEWRYDGSTWNREKVVADTNTLSGPFNDVKMTVNRSGLISRNQDTLDYLFGQIDIDDFTNNDRNVYAYGDKGFLKTFDSASYSIERTINSVTNNTNQVFDFDFKANSYDLDEFYSVRYTITQNDSQSISKNRKVFIGSSVTDTTPPSITIQNPHNQSSSSVDLNVTSNEAVDTWKYSLDGGSNQTFTPNSTLTGLSDGGHTVDVYANDTSGNTGSESVSFTVDAADDTPPTSSDNWTASGFVDKSQVDVEISASDTGGAGVANISYRVNGETYTTVQGTTATVTVSTEGNNTLEYYATDNDGNVEASNTEYVALDSTEPTSSDNYTQTGYVGYEPDIQISASDSTSGVANISYRVNGGSYSTLSGSTVDLTINLDGNNTLEYYATDKAGNQGSVQTEHVAVDTETPAISFNPSTTGSGQQSQSHIFVNVSASDSVTSVSFVEENFKESRQNLTENADGYYTFNHTGLSDGEYWVQVKAEDQAGNTGSTVNRSITLNTSTSNSAPSASFTASTTDLTVDVDASGSSDPDGTITSYSWDWTTDSSYEGTGQTASHSYGSDGDYTITLRVTDDDGATATTQKTVSVSSSSDSGGGGTTDPVEYVIENLALGKAAGLTSNPSQDLTQDGVNGVKTSLFGDNRDSRIAAELVIDYSQDISVQDLDFGSNRSEAKAFVHNQGTVANLQSTNLLVPRVDYTGKVLVCPGASALSGLSLGCLNGYNMTTGETVNGVTMSEVSLNGYDYYNLSGISGTGGLEVEQSSETGTGGGIGGGNEDPSNQPPEASFTYTPKTPGPGVEVSFASQSEDSDGNITSHNWEVNGSEFSEELNPGYEFDEKGLYNISLTVTDNGSASDTASKMIEVKTSKEGLEFYEKVGAVMLILGAGLFIAARF